MDLVNSTIVGDCVETMSKMPSSCVDLIFTSPPYYNARPQYAEYESYESYLAFLRKVVQNCHHVLAEGRFLVVNVSPVLIPRQARNKSSKRVAIPFDLHAICNSEGFDFIDDIIWVKPEGAGWSYGRGRRFSADRNPLQYKPLSVTEYLLVYRKHTDKLIDWNIRSKDEKTLTASKIRDGYEKTNVWNLSPSHVKHHPATFPVALAERVISYYSFVGDLVLDPFAGIGTVGKAALKHNRKYCLIELNAEYIKHFSP